MRADARLRMLAAVSTAALLFGVLINLVPERTRQAAVPDAVAAAEPAPAAYAGEVHERFQQAAAMLHLGQYLYALDALERVLELSPRLPEAHVNAGYALLGLQRPDRAAEYFMRAVDLRADQANAYYGLAVAYEELGDIGAALGAMRTFVHLSGNDDRHLARARAAIWEWSQRRQPASVAGTGSVDGNAGGGG